MREKAFTGMGHDRGWAARGKLMRMDDLSLIRCFSCRVDLTSLNENSRRFSNAFVVSVPMHDSRLNSFDDRTVARWLKGPSALKYRG